MLTSADKEVVAAKVRELMGELKDLGYNSRVSIESSDDRGDVVYRGEANNGFWRSSTAVCENPWEPSITDIEVEQAESWSSSHDC